MKAIKTILALCLMAMATAASAQSYVHITKSNGANYDFKSSDISSLTINTTAPTSTTSTGIPVRLLPGKFSVSDSKTVQFTSSNAYYDSYTSTWHLEEYAPEARYTYDNHHVNLFYWTTDVASACAQEYNVSSPATTDDFFLSENHKIDITASTSPSTTITGLYVLSSAEWSYLLTGRNNASSLRKYNVIIDGLYVCIVIAPDDYQGSIASAYTLSDAIAAGFVVMPLAGKRTYTSDGNMFDSQYTTGYYMTSTPNSSDASQDHILGSLAGLGFGIQQNFSRSYGGSIRLVK